MIDKDEYIKQFFEGNADYTRLGSLVDPDTVSEVRAILAKDVALTDRERDGLIELFAAAYRGVFDNRDDVP